MTSSLNPPSPPAAAAAAAAASVADNYGPVTKLAAIAAVRDEEARIQKRRLEQAKLEATASLVGETALAIAAANASGSPVRLSPAQQQTLPGRKELTPEGSFKREGSFSRTMPQISSSMNGSPSRTAAAAARSPPRKMSVAARARMAADIPTLALADGAGGGGGRSSRMPQPRGKTNLSASMSDPHAGAGMRAAKIKPAPSSGNAGVSRGKFTKAQIKQMVDEWGKSDTSDDDDDYCYVGTSDGSGGDDGGLERYKQSLQMTPHYLQYTMRNSPTTLSNSPNAMSHSPVRMGNVVSAEGAATLPSTFATEEEAEFHYQHHRVSNYSNTAGSAYGGGGSTTPTYQNQNRGHGPPNVGTPTYQNRSEDDDDDESGGLFTSVKSWLQSQRERLHQMELQRQVEDQRRKLVEEGRRQRAAEAERRRRNGAGHTAANNNNNDGAGDAASRRCARELCEVAQDSSSSVGCHLDADEIAMQTTEDLCNNINDQGTTVSGMPNLCGFGGIYANPHADDSTDYSGVPRVDSLGNVLEMIPSEGSLDSLGEELAALGIKVSSPKCTLSGNGMSVKVDVPDDDEYQDNDNDENGVDDDNNNSKGDGNDNNNNSNNKDDHVEEEEEDDDDDDPMISFESDVKVVPEPPQDDVSASPQILRPAQMKSLIASGALPPSLNFCKWKRLYSLTRDGDSFEQFLRLVEGHDRTVLAVKTTRGEMFGGYADTRWEAKRYRRHACDFYGSAQACLFRFPNRGGTGAGGRRNQDKISIYRWTGANRYIQVCDAAKRTVAFGGGGAGGVFGLCIEEDFRRGTTGHCSTFENEPLCDEGYFDVMDLEVWGFTLDYF